MATGLRSTALRHRGRCRSRTPLPTAGRLKGWPSPRPTLASPSRFSSDAQCCRPGRHHGEHRRSDCRRAPPAFPHAQAADRWLYERFGLRGADELGHVPQAVKGAVWSSTTRSCAAHRCRLPRAIVTRRRVSPGVLAQASGRATSCSSQRPLAVLACVLLPGAARVRQKPAGLSLHRLGVSRDLGRGVTRAVTEVSLQPAAQLLGSALEPLSPVTHDGHPPFADRTSRAAARKRADPQMA